MEKISVKKESELDETKQKFIQIGEPENIICQISTEIGELPSSYSFDFTKFANQFMKTNKGNLYLSTTLGKDNDHIIHIHRDKERVNANAIRGVQKINISRNNGFEVHTIKEIETGQTFILGGLFIELFNILTTPQPNNNALNDWIKKYV